MRHDSVHLPRATDKDSIPAELGGEDESGRIRATQCARRARCIVALVLLIGLSSCAGGLSPHEMMRAEQGTVLVEATLVAKSEVPSLNQIAPYREALVVYEYRVEKLLRGKLKGDRIGVVHWAIYDNQIQEIARAKPGERRRLSLRRFDEFAQLQQIFISDSLELDLNAPLYYDVSQQVLPNSSVKKRYDYRCTLSDTMPAFWMLKDQLRLVVLGDSRGLEGVRTELFYGEVNRETPIAYNLSVTSAPIELQQILVKDYLSRLPRLKWVVYQLSPRVLNRYYHGWKDRNLRGSRGYRFDQKHALLLWSQSPDAPVTVATLEATPYVSRRWHEYPWGWHEREGTWDHPEIGDWPRKWEISKERLQILETMIERLEQQGVRMLVYLSPIHPIIRRVDVVDDDGTTKQGYREVVQLLQELAQKHSNLVFLDLLQEGNHDFAPNLFADLDHLNRMGATKLTTILEEIRRQYEP